MSEQTRNFSTKKLIILTMVVVIGILVFIALASWIITRGVEDNAANVPTIDNSTNQQAPQPIPAEPSNPNVTGGSSGAGNTTSNDPSIGTPSPAGGVDTNQVPAGQ